DIYFDVGFRLDILVDDKVIIEIKSVESLSDVHHKQLLTYLKLTGKKLGLLINFNSSSISNSIIRIVNNL
ncbi:MAG: GxxExxY protein, partial [Bacteroidetes bacterium]|nr:GxxExxY protein [Bacteroidota bacterium]